MALGIAGGVGVGGSRQGSPRNIASNEPFSQTRPLQPAIEINFENGQSGLGFVDINTVIQQPQK